MRGSQKNREPRLAVRAVKGTVFSTAATGDGKQQPGQDKTQTIKERAHLQGLALLESSDYPPSRVRKGTAGASTLTIGMTLTTPVLDVCEKAMGLYSTVTLH